MKKQAGSLFYGLHKEARSEKRALRNVLAPNVLA